MTDEDLLDEIEAQRSLMISVSTGGSRIDSVNGEYIQRRDRIKDDLRERNLEDPNPYSNLWMWYGKWSSGDLPTYQSRRNFITELYQPLIDYIRDKNKGSEEKILRPPTGWVRVDRDLEEVRKTLEEANTELQFQQVGLCCRETIISLAQAVCNPDIHVSFDNTRPSDTDAYRMLEGFIKKELTGGSNEAVRRHAKASLNLANVLQHQRTAEFRDAALCAEATSSIVRIIDIISGQRDGNVNYEEIREEKVDKVVDQYLGFAFSNFDSGFSALERADGLELNNKELQLVGQKVKNRNGPDPFQGWVQKDWDHKKALEFYQDFKRNPLGKGSFEEEIKKYFEK